MRTTPLGHSTEPPLSVRRLEPGRFFVKSAVAGSSTWYLVDFSEPRFPDGHCKCTDYSVRIERYIVRGEEPKSRQCKHIRKVRSVLRHAKHLCSLAGLDYSEAIIPPL